MCAGHLPFSGDDKREIKHNIATGRIRPLPITLSDMAMDFITCHAGA